MLEALEERPDKGASCCNIDSDLKAIQISKSLCDILDFGEDGMSFRCTKVGSGDKENVDLYKFDVVCLAALVGETQCQKQQILARVVQSMRPGAMMLLRSAHGLRSLLYPVSCHLPFVPALGIC